MAVTASYKTASGGMTYSWTAVAGVPNLVAAPTTVLFGGVLASSTTQQVVTVSNTGNMPLLTPSISVSGAAYAQTNNCAAALAVGANCAVTVIFTPVAAQQYPGSLSIGFSNLTAKSVALSGAVSPSYATWDPANLSPGTALSANNLTMFMSSQGQPYTQATVAKSTGKWYWEVVSNITSAHPAYIGISTSSISKTSQAAMFGAINPGYYGQYAASGATPSSLNTGPGTYTVSATGTLDVSTTYGLALDADAGTFTIYNNCVKIGTYSNISTAKPYKPTISTGGNTAVPNITANFGATAFNCAVPSGYNAGLY